MCELPVWLDDTFILAIFGLCGGGLGYLLVFCLKSRCQVIECCCIKCQRDVIPSNELTSVSVTRE